MERASGPGKASSSAESCEGLSQGGGEGAQARGCGGGEGESAGTDGGEAEEAALASEPAQMASACGTGSQLPHLAAMWRSRNGHLASPSFLLIGNR